MSAFGANPEFRGGSKAELFEAALSQPMNLGATFWDQAKGGVLESFGLGTAIRDVAIPEGNVAPEVRDRENVVAPMLNPLAQAYIYGRKAVQALNPEQPTLSKDAYEASAWFRQDIPWDEGMTEDRAASLASWYDAKKVREYYAEKRPITAFLGNLAGQAVDPINYIPIAGPSVRAANVARFGTVKGIAATSALDAAGNTAVFGLATRETRASFGDDVSWQRTVSEIATAALIGGAFGSIAGALGRRADAKVKAEVENRLATLKTTQEARIALNEAIDGLVTTGDVRLSPNATEPLARVAREAAAISRAYDDVRSEPTGDLRDPLVAITPEDMDAVLVGRGAFKGFNEVEFNKRGWGLVKVIWGHGDKSQEPPEFQVRKDDVTALPQVVRDFKPASVSDDGMRREWRVERNGRTVVYADTMFEGGRHLVTTFIERADASSAGKQLSAKKPAALPGSRPQAVNLAEDTAGGRSIGEPGAGQAMPATGNIARSPAIDNTAARADPIPEGRAQAESAIAKPDDYKALAAQYRIDPETGSFIEEAEIAQVEAEGRLTDADRAELETATATYENGAAYGKALDAAVACLI